MKHCLEAAESSLNDAASTVKLEIMERASTAGTPLHAKQFDVSREEGESQGANISMFTVLSPSRYAPGVKHVILALS